MRKGIVILSVCLLAACNSYTMVKKEQTTVESISLVPAGLWNAAPNYVSFNNIPTWTADGAFLNTVMFFPNVADGQALVKATAEEKYPKYETTMLPNEVMELTKATIAKMYATTVADEGELKPFKMVTGTGFQFSFNFADQDGLTRKLLATGVVKDKQLHMVIYQAADLYFYQKDFANVQQMMKSITIL